MGITPDTFVNLLSSTVLLEDSHDQLFYRGSGVLTDKA